MKQRKYHIQTMEGGEWVTYHKCQNEISLNANTEVLRGNKRAYRVFREKELIDEFQPQTETT